jgi:DNA-binding protein HU-beta
MNTADLVERVAVEHGVAKDHTKKILDSAFAAIAAAASAGEEVTLGGFGRFKVTDRAERQGRNPATGETITIAASKKLAFTAAKNIRDALNAGEAAASSMPVQAGE